MALDAHDDRAPGLDTGPRTDCVIVAAPAGRRWTAHAIDFTIVLVVFSLFLAPIITVYSRPGSTSLALVVSAWVYVAVFAGLAVSLARGRRHQRTYVTVGMSIMRIRPVRTVDGLRFVDDHDEQDGENERRGLAMAAVAAPLIVLGIALVVFELFAYL